MRAGSSRANYAHKDQAGRASCHLDVPTDIGPQFRFDLCAHGPPIKNVRRHALLPTMPVICWPYAVISSRAVLRRLLNITTSSWSFIESRLARTIHAAPAPALEARSAPVATSLSTFALPISAIR